MEKHPQRQLSIDTLKKPLFDPPSSEAQKFFYLFFQSNASLIKEYLGLVNSNTDSLYKALAALTSSTCCIHLGKRDSGVPMLGLHFTHMIDVLFRKLDRNSETYQTHLINLTSFMQYFLTAKSLDAHIPISLRISFGFASLNFTECATALRLTVGLENKEVLQNLANLIIKENLKISNDLQSIVVGILTGNTELLDKVGFVLARPDLKEWMQNNQVKLIDFSKDQSFNQVIEYIYEELIFAKSQ